MADSDRGGGSLSGLTSDEAREFHRIFMTSFVIFTVIAVIAQRRKTIGEKLVKMHSVFPMCCAKMRYGHRSVNRDSFVQRTLGGRLPWKPCYKIEHYNSLTACGNSRRQRAWFTRLFSDYPAGRA